MALEDDMEEEESPLEGWSQDDLQVIQRIDPVIVGEFDENLWAKVGLIALAVLLFAAYVFSRSLPLPGC